MKLRWFLSGTVRQADGHVQACPKTAQCPARHPFAPGRRAVDGASARDAGSRRIGATPTTRRCTKQMDESGKSRRPNGSSRIRTPNGGRTWKFFWWPSSWRWASALFFCNRSRFPPARCSRRLFGIDDEGFAVDPNFKMPGLLERVWDAGCSRDHLPSDYRAGRWRSGPGWTAGACLAFHQ